MGGKGLLEMLQKLGVEEDLSHLKKPQLCKRIQKELEKRDLILE